MLFKLVRLFRYRLVIPILRSQSPPVETARGVLVGLVSAMNPFVGIQMALVGGFWAFQRFLLPCVFLFFFYIFIDIERER